MNRSLAARALLMVIWLGAALPVHAEPQTGAAALPTSAAQRLTVAEEVRFDGVVEALHRSMVAAQTSGRVMALPFDIGDEVPAGAVIVRLTSAEQAAAVDAAAGTVAEARARMTEARQAFQRAEDIFAQQLISRSEFDRVQAAFRSAESRLAAAEANLRSAREALKYTLVKAPYGGIVAARHVELGETVNPGMPLMTGLSLDRLRVRVHVPQHYVQALRDHRAARVLLPDGDALTPDKLRFPPMADPATHSFELRLELPPGQHGVYPGTLVKVAFVHARRERLLIPASAVVRRGELTAAYVQAADATLALRYLRLGSVLPDGQVPVESGLRAGEQVVTDPVAAAVAYKRLDAPRP